jgi:hypothetical protein
MLETRERPSSSALDNPDTLQDGLRRWLSQPRVLVALLLTAGGLVWAIARGLHYYGMAPADLVYDLDQPPMLLLLVGAWLSYRSAQR